MVNFTRSVLGQIVGIFVLVQLAHGIGYNPLDITNFPGYKPDKWSLTLTDGGLSATVADFKRPSYLSYSTKPECIRAVVFMGHGTALDHVQAECDGSDGTVGLTSQESFLKYLDLGVVFQEAAGRFALFKKTGVKDKCSKKVYTLEECTDKCPGPRATESESSEIACKEVAELKLPPMLLISSQGGLGNFKAANEQWLMYNPFEPLGYVSREYELEDKCFRLFMVTSKGRAVHPVKLTCGPVYDVTSTVTSLHLADTLYVTVDPEGKFTVLLKTQNDQCVEKKIAVEEKDGSTAPNVLSNNMLTMEDEACRNLAKGEIQDIIVSKENIKGLRDLSIKERFDRPILEPYTLSGYLLDYNLGRDMGLMIQPYTKTGEEDISQIVTMVAQGVPVLPVIIKADYPKYILVQKKVVYFGKDVVFKKLYAVNAYEVVKRTSDSECYRKLFSVTAGSVDASETDETLASVPNITTDDPVCKDLIEGKHLRAVDTLDFKKMEQLIE